MAWVSMRPNDKVEQLAANNLTIPQDAIASLLQRLVLAALVLHLMPQGAEVEAKQLLHLERHSDAERSTRSHPHDIRIERQAAP